MPTFVVHVATATTIAPIVLPPNAEAKIDARPSAIISVAAVTATMAISMVAMAIATIVDCLCQLLRNCKAVGRINW